MSKLKPDNEFLDDKNPVDPKSGEVLPRRPFAKRFVGRSMTKQNHVKDLDMNRIVDNARRRGYLPPTVNPGFYADVSSIPSFEEAFDLVERSKSLFAALPAKLRDQLKHNPANLEPWLSNPANHPEAVRLGLLKKSILEKNDTSSSPTPPPLPPKTPPPTAPPASGSAST